MLFLEEFARPLMVGHAISAGVLVGASSHHLLWCRRYLRRDFRRYAAERTFAWVSAAAFVSTFFLGNLMYPVYKVRVRAEFFDNPAAVLEEAKSRDAQHRALGVAVEGQHEPASLVSVAHVFDIKEHWVALGCAASVLLWVFSRRAHPRESPEMMALYLGLSAAACATAWTGAVIGLVTASYRSVGGL